MLVTVRRKFIQLGASWGCMLGTCWLWHGCLSTWGYLELYVGKLQGLKLMFVQLGGTWDCMLVTYGSLRRNFVQVRAGSLSKLGLLETLCWQPMGLWDGCLSTWGYLGLYVGNLFNLELLGTLCWQSIGALKRMFCPTGDYLGLYVGNRHGFETDVRPTRGYLNGMLTTYRALRQMPVQLGATWDCMLAIYGTLRRKCVQLGATWDVMLATYRALGRKFVQLGTTWDRMFAT